MSRSLKKPLNINSKLQEKIEKANKENKKTAFKVWVRAAVITPEMIGHTLLIHWGKGFASRQVTQDMVGYKIGQFAPTRRSGQHGKAGTH